MRPCATVVTLTPPAFTWRVVESDDYATYIANLRHIGCPEKTIQRHHSGGHSKALQNPRVPARAGGGAEILADGGPAGRRGLRAAPPGIVILRQEKRVLLKSLLGFEEDPDFWLAWQEFSSEPIAIAIIVGYLPEEKQEHTYAVYRKYDDVAKDYREFASGVYTPLDYKQQDAIYEQMKTDYGQLLAGDELAEPQGEGHRRGKKASRGNGIDGGRT